jgi:hypothetical protein
MDMSLELLGIGMTVLMIISLCFEHLRLESGELYTQEASFTEKFLKLFDWSTSADKSECEEKRFFPENISQKSGFVKENLRQFSPSRISSSRIL